MNPVELGFPALAMVVIIGLLTGTASFWLFRRTTDARKLHIAINRVMAHLFEFRLFSAEPAVILKAQRDLLVANGLVLRTMALPLLLLLLPVGSLVAIMEAFFARAPLSLEAPAVVTIRFLDAALAANAAITLTAPRGVTIETPPVRAITSSEISWRLRATTAVSGDLQFQWNGHSALKSISFGKGLRLLSNYRAGSLTGFLAHPLELPFSSGAVESIRLEYPAARVFGLHWAIWFSLASISGALLARAINRGSPM